MMVESSCHIIYGNNEGLDAYNKTGKKLHEMKYFNFITILYTLRSYNKELITAFFLFR